MATGKYGPIPVPDIENWNLDREVDPATKVTGIMGKTSGDCWVYAAADSNGLLKVSAYGVNITDVQNLDPDNFLVSAYAKDAGQLHVSAYYAGSTFAVSNNDAGYFRVSALYGEKTFAISNSNATNLMVSGRSDDASLFRVSALGVNITDVQNLDPDNFLVSAYSKDAGQMHVSAIGTITVSSHEIKQSDAASLRISTFPGFYNINTVFIGTTSGGTVYQSVEYYGSTTRTTNFGYDDNSNISAISCVIS